MGLNLQCVVLVFFKISFETTRHLIFMLSYCSFFFWVQQNSLVDILQTVLLNIFGFSTQGLCVSFWFMYHRKKIKYITFFPGKGAT